jgi:predicted phage-related endonuclease
VVAQLSFDKLAFVKRLSAAGMDAQLAEVLAEALDEMVFDTLATKSDLSELGVSLRSEIKELETSLRSEIKELELRLTNSLTVRFGAMIAAAVAIIGTLNGLF